MAGDIEHIRDTIDSMRAEVTSFIKSYNENNVDVQQRLTEHSSWREAHERLDDERWHNLEKKLAEMKAMVESIPVEIGKDLGHLETSFAALSTKVSQHDSALERIRTVWLTVSLIASAAFALAEFVLHQKGG